MDFTTFVVVAVAVVYSVNSITCPTCDDPRDHTTCNVTQACHQNNDVCETRINRHENHTLEYHCAHAQNCADQENRNGCDSPTTGGACVICCSGLADCRVKTDAYFATVTIIG